MSPTAPSLPERAFRLGFQIAGPLLPTPTARVARKLLFEPRSHAPRDWECEVEQPGASRQLELRGHPWAIDPRPLEARVWEPVGSARGSALLLHGWEGRSSQFARLGPRLARAGWRAIALDLPAHGGSPGRGTHVHDMALGVRAAAHQLGDFDLVVGHSMGGAVATVALARGAASDAAPRARAAVLLACPADLLGVLREAADRLGLRGRARATFFEELRRDVGTPLAGLQPLSCAERLDMPALIVHDPADAEVEFVHAERLARAWRGAELEALEGVGHWRILRDERVLERTVAFAEAALARPRSGAPRAAVPLAQ